MTPPTAHEPSGPVSAILTATAQGVAGALPSAEPLRPGDAQPGDEQLTGRFAGAVVADLTGAVRGRIAILVGEDLVAALASSPMGALDLASAVQPALDTAASMLGARASAARELDLALVLHELGGPSTAVPLLGSTLAAALLVPDATLATAAGTPAPSTPTAPSPVSALPGTPRLRPVAGGRGIEMLHGVEMEVTVELGRTRMTVRDLLALAPGTVLELDRAAGSPADLLVNGRLIARGEVVVVDEDFGLRVTEIVDESAAV
ncbi:flagellar motor switch protein FliN [Nocardioides dongkuii]|uniref:flagellar motor switch protein FliN n=1 Tax=Nocardioides dongkuii TaxID=2760089 RepID=UPI0015FCCCAE|nr:flagellar motor switch protein FliN [Nocardioides dongkuii]